MSSPSKMIRPEVGCQGAGDHVEDGGLAGAIGADQAGDAALFNLQTAVVDRIETAECLRQVFKLQHPALVPPMRSLIWPHIASSLSRPLSGSQDGN